MVATGRVYLRDVPEEDMFERVCLGAKPCWAGLFSSCHVSDFVRCPLALAVTGGVYLRDVLWHNE